MCTSSWTPYQFPPNLNLSPTALSLFLVVRAPEKATRPQQTPHFSASEKRLSESFKQVSDRLEKVHKGLGEMQSIASGVGDLKKVLSSK